MRKLGTCLWFDHQAEDAAAFYVSLFPNSGIVDAKYCLEGAPRPAGLVLCSAGYNIRWLLRAITRLGLKGLLLRLLALRVTLSRIIQSAGVTRFAHSSRVTGAAG